MDEIKKLKQAKAVVVDRDDKGKTKLVTFRGYARSLTPRRERVLVFESDDGQLKEAYIRFDRRDLSISVYIDALFDATRRQRLDALRLERDELYLRISAIDKEIETMKVEVDPLTQPLEPNERFRQRWAQSLDRAREVQHDRRAQRRAKLRKADKEAREQEEAKAEIRARTVKARPQFPADKFDRVWEMAILTLAGRRLNVSKKSLLESMPEGLWSWQGKVRGGSAWFWTRITKAITAAENGEEIRPERY